jgi:hypothetical protein
MNRNSLLALSVGLTVVGCVPVQNEGLNEFCEQDANCAAGLTCSPNLENVCFFGDCVNTVHGSACCDAQYLVDGNCCAPPRQIVQVLGVGELCGGSPAGTPTPLKITHGDGTASSAPISSESAPASPTTTFEQR